MADKFLKQSNGFLQEVEGLVTSAGAGDSGKIPALDTNGRLTDSTMSRAPTASSAGAGDAAKLVALDGAGRIDTTMMPVGFGDEADTFVASEALGAGDFVNIWNDSGTAKARLADASSSAKTADGFVTAAVLSGANAKVFKEGVNDQLSGLTPAARYFLSDSVPGGVTATAPTGSGKVIQVLGKAKSATEMISEPGSGQPIVVLV